MKKKTPGEFLLWWYIGVTGGLWGVWQMSKFLNK